MNHTVSKLKDIDSQVCNATSNDDEKGGHCILQNLIYRIWNLKYDDDACTERTMCVK